MSLSRILTLAALFTFSLAPLTQQPAHAQSAAHRAMAVAVKELSVEGVSLQKTLDYLRDVSGANIVVNWKVLEAAGVARETPITLTVKELPLRKMMQLVLDQASPNAALVFSIDSNVIQITTQEEADKQMITKVYIVDDLIMAPSNKQAPSLNLGVQSNQNGQGNNSNNNSNGGLFGNDNGNNNNNNGSNNNGNSNGNNGNSNNQQKTAQERGDELVALIREVVRPTIWRENGGQATIRYFGGKLIVTAPASVQEAIGGPVNSGIRYGN